MTRTCLLGALCAALLATAGTAAAKPKTTVVYDDFNAPGYSLTDYAQKWTPTFGLLEMAVNDTRNFTGGQFNASAVPFTVGADFSVFDHLKYIAISNQSFALPQHGTVRFGSTITGRTPGTIDGLTINGVFGPPFGPVTGPYSATVLEGQQAGVVMNVVDFCTGQLFDWFVSETKAFTLIERLPSNVTNNIVNPGCPGATHVGRDDMYTQIVDEVPIASGVPHRVEIEVTQTPTDLSVEYFLDGRKVSKVKNVGVPLDAQGVKYTGTYPSLGAGEPLRGQIGSFSIGHGLFSLIDAFPYQHPESPELSVSIPVGTSNPADAGNARLFGQGASGSWDDFTVTTEAK
jgi:Family of unknown function (DUF6081)